MVPRYVTQGRQNQGEAEQVIYQIDVTNWGASPASVAIEVLDVTANNAVVTSTVTTGAASVSGNIISLPTLQSLMSGHLYRYEVSFTVSGNKLECYFEVLAED